MKFFLSDFLNRMSSKNRNGVMLINKFLKIFSQFFKIWVECPFKFFTSALIFQHFLSSFNTTVCMKCGITEKIQLMQCK